MRRLLLSSPLLLLVFCSAGCKSAADKCLGTGWVSSDPALCEAACNDDSLKHYQQSEACYFLGKIYRSGTQVPHDLKKARAALAKGCKVGSSSACAELKKMIKK